jgi:hypothetical protein
MAALTRMGSTFLYGLEVDQTVFTSDIQKLVSSD